MLKDYVLAKSKFNQAFQYANEIIENNSKTAMYYLASYIKLFCLKKLGNSIDSEKEYLVLIENLIKETLENPWRKELYIFIAMCYKEIKNYNNALDIINFLLSANENMAEAYLLRSEIYKELGELELAEKDKNIAKNKSEFEDAIIKVGDVAEPIIINNASAFK